MDTHSQFLNKILVVGSGSLDSFPKPECNCKVCESARKGGKDKRIPASSILYKNCLFDCGTEVWERLVKFKIKPKAIVISHLHTDHIDSLLRYPLISRTIPVYASKFYQVVFNELKIKVFKYFKPNESFEPIKGLKVDSKVAVHTFVRPCSIFKFDNIAYAPDLGDLRESDIEFLQGTKIYFGDGFDLEHNFQIEGEMLHLATYILLKKLKRVKSLKEVYLLGISHRTGWPHEDLEVILRNFCFKNALEFSVEPAFDCQLISNS